jgi:predicted amidophosphoribosyltransferase
MYCTECDVMDMPGKFCSECGGILEERTPPCSNCGNPEAFGPFCHMCGNNLDQDACPSCESANQKGDFCKRCGHELSSGREHKDATEAALDEIRKDNKISSELPTPTTVFCLSCYAKGKRYRSDGTRVRLCTVCGAPEMYLKFDD